MLLINILLKEVTIIIKNNISWAEFDDRLNEVFGKKMKCVDDLYFNVVKRINVGEIICLEDLGALKLLQDMYSMSGELCIITDYCYEKGCGPFIVEADEISDFVKGFKKQYGNAFYSTDVIVINFMEKLIWVLFHEGICWLSKG